MNRICRRGRVGGILLQSRAIFVPDSLAECEKSGHYFARSGIVVELGKRDSGCSGVMSTATGQIIRPLGGPMLEFIKLNGSMVLSH